MCSSTWQLYIHVPTLSGTTSAVCISACARGHDVRTMSAIRDDISMPMWSVPVDCSTEGDKIPTDSLPFFHCHQRSVGIHVAVDRGAQVCAAESGADEGESSVEVGRLTFQFVYALRIGGVGLNIVVEIPAARSQIADMRTAPGHGSPSSVVRHKQCTLSNGAYRSRFVDSNA